MSHAAFLSFLLALGSVASDPGDGPPPPAAHRVDYDREVRPILVKSCVRCHGSGRAKGGLVLDEREPAIRGGDNGPAIVPGDSAASRLIRYASGVDDDAVMPPIGAGEPLSDEQVGLLRAWIDQGAAWPESSARRKPGATDHWAFVPPRRPEPPRSRPGDSRLNPIDAFVRDRLASIGLAPSPEADRATLLRRLSLDLIGLPPTIAELDAFLADHRPDAYDRQVDRLLASPHYGERWARRWLDRARYADTNGYEKDRERSIWPYRDWVIDALNRDMPFDRFTVEQIAGDLLPDATPSQKVATGFHRNTMINEEGGIDVEEFRFAAVVDRVATTGSVWLGLTIQCAQCHTHKYDPITHRDYYRIFAFLNNADEPDLVLPTPADLARSAKIEAEASTLDASRAEVFPGAPANVAWSLPKPERLNARSSTSLVAASDGSVVASGSAPEVDSYELIYALPPGRFDAIRVETRSEPGADVPGPGRTNHGNFVVTGLSASLRLADGSTRSIALSKASADVEQAGFPAAGAIDGDPKTGWAIDDGTGAIRRPHALTVSASEPFGGETGTHLILTLSQDYGGGHTLGRFRVATRLVGSEAVGSPTPDRASRETHLRQRLAEWIDARRTADWSFRTPGRLRSVKGATLDLRPDHSVLARGDKPNNDVYEVDLDGDLGGTTAFRLEVLPDPTLPDDGPGRAPLFSVGDFLLTEFSVAMIQPDGSPSPNRLALAGASEDYSEKGHPAALAIDGATDTGWTVKGGIGRPHAAVFVLRDPLPVGTRRVRVTLRQDGIHQMTIGRFRLSTTADRPPVVASGLTSEVETAIRTPSASRSPRESALIRDAFLSSAPELSALNRRIADLRRTKPRPATTMVMEERRPSEARTTRIHRRGEFLQVGEPVEPGTPAVLHPFQSDAPRNRLGLARWLVAPDNPLTARVLVNGAWQAFFGRGIVATVDDFGVRGEKPSHPELLDWLATEVVRLGWSQKALHRLIVTSATYRQSSRTTAAATARDPQNEWLARGPRFRVDAETVRDIALVASGLFNPKLGGPSVFPPQPDGVTALAYGQVAWPTSAGAERYRRGLYTYTKRTAPYATFGLFDAPSSDTACLRRERSNTPLQALTLLNDPVYVEAARGLVDRLEREAPPTVEGRIRHAFRICLAREPSPDEIVPVAAFQRMLAGRIRRGELDDRLGRPGSSSRFDPAERAAWVAVARALLNLDETITKE